MLGFEQGDVCPDLGITPMPLQKSTRLGSSMSEQRLVDEVEGRRRALDVQEDGANVLQLDAVRGGMYVGPMHSGW